MIKKPKFLTVKELARHHAAIVGNDVMGRQNRFPRVTSSVFNRVTRSTAPPRRPCDEWQRSDQVTFRALPSAVLIMAIREMTPIWLAKVKGLIRRRCYLTLSGAGSVQSRGQ